MNYDVLLDVKGLNCPLPILKAKKVLNTMSSGQILKVLATDPSTTKDFQTFVKYSGDKLLNHFTDPERIFTFFLEKR